MTALAQPGVISPAPDGSTPVSPTASLDFTTTPWSSCLGEDVHITGSTKQSGWEKTDGLVYTADFLNVGDSSTLTAFGVTTGKPFKVLAYALRQKLTRDSSSGTTITTAHVERHWLVQDPQTWKTYRFVNKYDLVSSPWSYTEDVRVDDCIQL